MKTCLNLRLLFSIGVCGLALRFPATLARAEETPVFSATPAATAAAGSPTATPTPEPPAVRWVGVRDSNGEKREMPKAYAGRSDEIWVDVIKFKEWLNSLGDKKSEEWDPKHLILYLNHVPLKGVHPFYWYDWTYQEWTGRKVSAEYAVTTFGFSLVRDEDSKPAWSHLLNKPGFNRKVVVSVGFENGEEIRSQLAPDDSLPKKLSETEGRPQINTLV
jgi:hypothetical protein